MLQKVLVITAVWASLVLFFLQGNMNANAQVITNQSYHTGLEYLNKGKYDFAIYDFGKAIESENIIDAYFWRGVCYFRLEKFDKALADFNAVIDKNQKYLDAYIYRGKLYYKEDKLRAAVDDFSVAYALDTSNVEILKDRVIIYNQLGEYPLAIQDLKRLIIKTPNYPENFATLGTLQMKITDYPGAIYSLTRAIELHRKESNGQDPELYFNRGLAKLELNDLSGACDDFIMAGNLGSAEAVDKSQEICASAKK